MKKTIRFKIKPLVQEYEGNNLVFKKRKKLSEEETSPFKNDVGIFFS